MKETGKHPTPIGPSRIEELEKENAALRAEIESLNHYIDRTAAENAKCKQEVSDLKAYYEPMETEFARMRAQLDIVHLIFGR